MDQGIGVHHFDRRRELRDPSLSHPSQGFVGGEDERRAQAFAFAEQAVARDVLAGHRGEHPIHAGPHVREIPS